MKGKVKEMAKYFILDTDYDEIVKGRLLTEKEYKELEYNYSEYVLNFEDEDGEVQEFVRCETLSEVFGNIKEDMDNNAMPEQLMRYSIRKCLPYNYTVFCVEDDGEIHEVDR